MQRKVAETAFSVRLPPAKEDHPSALKVGVIAAVGFAVGVAWPRLAGVRVGPSAPSEVASAARAPESAAAAPALPSATAASTVAPAAPPGSSAVTAAEPAGAVGVAVGHGAVIGCRTEEGDSLKGGAACGPLGGFDGIAQPRLRKLATCGAAAGATGKLNAVFGLDFKKNTVSIDVGRSSTVSNPDGYAACLRTAFQGVSIGAINHDHPRYVVVYGVTFRPDAGEAGTGGAATGAPAPATAPAAASPSEGGTAEIVWEVALVRDKPRTGAVVARLPRGSKVRMGTGDEGWYRIQYGDGFASEGWLYRGAIGK